MSSYETLLSVWHKTLTYSNIFDYPLTKDEIFLYALTHRPSKEEDFNKWYKKNLPLLQSQYEFDGNYWALKGRSQLFTIRLERNKISQTKLSHAKTLTFPLFLLPWVKHIAVTGTAAALNARKSDDIDLFIVTSPGRTWLTRFIVLTYLTILGRRYNNKKQSSRNMYCLNHIVDSVHLEDIKHDVYIANELIRMKQIWDKDNTYQKLIDANHWITSFTNHWFMDYLHRSKNNAKPAATHKNTDDLVVDTAAFILLAPLKTPVVLFSWILDWLEAATKKIQEERLKRSLHTTHTDTLLTSHPHDNRVWILREYSDISLQKN